MGEFVHFSVTGAEFDADSDSVFRRARAGGGGWRVDIVDDDGKVRMSMCQPGPAPPCDDPDCVELREVASDMVGSSAAARDLPEGWSMVQTRYVTQLSELLGLAEESESDPHG